MRHEGVNAIVLTSTMLDADIFLSSLFFERGWLLFFYTRIHPNAPAWEVELAPICFHDNHETVSTLPARPAVTALFFFCFLSAK